MTLAVPTSTEERALNLLGQNVPAAQVAMAIGVSESMISQLVSNPEFSAKVFERRYKTLLNHTNRDSVYDDIESQLANKLKDLLPLMLRPMEVLKAISVINSVKRRGQVGDAASISSREVTTIVMPVQVIQHFTKNVNNQIITAGGKDLTTVQSGRMTDLLDKQTAEEAKLLENSNVQTAPGSLTGPSSQTSPSASSVSAS